MAQHGWNYGDGVRTVAAGAEPPARARRFLPAVLVSVLAGCGTGVEVSESPPEATVAILRSVVSPDPGPQGAFVDELARLGYREGDNLELLAADPGEVHVDAADIAETVEGWLDDDVDLIVALSTTGAMAAAQAAPETDILFLSNDPLVTGLVQDEVAPEGHLTGVTFRVPADRTLSLAARAVPGLDRLGLLFPPADPAATPVRDDVVGAASDRDIEVVVRPFERDGEVGPALTALRQAGADALVLASSPATVRALPALDAANRGEDALPVIANTTAVEEALLVLEPDSERLYRQLGSQAARLLDGVPVAEVPVEDPGNFRLVLNQRVAEELGVALPADLLAEADEVIS